MGFARGHWFRTETYRGILAETQKEVWQRGGWRAMMAAKHIGKQSNLGHSHSAETKKKMRAAALKRWGNPDYRRNMVLKHKGQTMSAEARRKAGESLRKRHSAEGWRWNVLRFWEHDMKYDANVVIKALKERLPKEVVMPA